MRSRGTAPQKVSGIGLSAGHYWKPHKYHATETIYGQYVSLKDIVKRDAGATIAAAMSREARMTANGGVGALH